MKIRREVKVGIFGLLMLVVAYWGISFLKGVDILSSSNTYHIVYSKSDNIEISSPILIKGIKVGTVTAVYITDLHGDINVDVKIKKRYKIPENSVAVITNKSVLGGKAIDLQIGDSPKFIEEYGNIKGEIDNNMGEQIDQLKNKLTATLDELTLALSGINKLLNEENLGAISSTIGNINAASGNVNSAVVDLKNKLAVVTSDLAVLTGTLKESAPQLSNTISNLSLISDTLALQMPAIMASVNQTVSEVDKTISKINSGEGSLGLLLNDGSLYNNLNTSSGNLSLLLEDIRLQPKRYVHFSVFGGKKDKKGGEKVDLKGAVK